MPHDVFVSYAPEDKPTADAVCARLEENGRRCWIAPRDIVPGTEWGAATVDAIENAKIMVLVFSSRANASRQIVHEVERAVNKGVTIIPFRIEDVVPARNLEYFLSTPHWLDAMTPPLNQHLDYLADTVGSLINRGELPAPGPQPAVQDRLHRRQPLIIAGSLLALFLIAILTFALTGGRKSTSDSTVQSGQAGVDSVLVGNWQITNSELGSRSGMWSGGSTDWRIKLGTDGQYSSDITLSDSGTAELGSNSYMTLISDSSGTTHYVSWRQSGNSAMVRPMSDLMPSTMFIFLAVYGEADQQFFIADETLERNSGSAGGQSVLTGTWEQDTKSGSLSWHLSITFTPNGHYAAEAKTTDTGRFEAKDGHWRQISTNLGLLEGKYQAAGADTASFKDEGDSVADFNFQTSWKRISQ